MKALLKVICLVSWLILSACSIMPADVEQTALPPMDFQELVQNARAHRGQMVIVGGYVVQVENHTDHTRITALEVPLGFRREPVERDRSRGRLILIYDGFIDPEVYTEGRKFTAAGYLLGSSAVDPEPEPFPYLRIAVETLHLWSEQQPVRYEPYYRDPWMYPYGHPWWWRHPYWWW
ncbi:Slp family lipoprotein [Desulfatitalea alkaliphila]|uniref:Slp family lipoprotein n=1 Tax=Desulfatitalea alkaliphila TaxID=2929485 RepID=A0AA41UIN1_9BACT|nr:Slp family lipoprotein [Desulfatitalea alkaliphila]MCJ8500955.1 Slp family lipoprotein [Desulfatitalea alkaliphila]